MFPPAVDLVVPSRVNTLEPSRLHMHFFYAHATSSSSHRNLFSLLPKRVY